jgi:hypothetical protein
MSAVKTPTENSGVPAKAIPLINNYMSAYCPILIDASNKK